MSVLKAGVVVAACAAVVAFTLKAGVCQQSGAKTKPAPAERWADDPAPPHCPPPMGFGAMGQRKAVWLGGPSQVGPGGGANATMRGPGGEPGAGPVVIMRGPGGEAGMGPRAGGTAGDGRLLSGPRPAAGNEHRRAA